MPQLCVGRTSCTHSQLIRCRLYLLHHRPHHPRLDQVQTVPLTPLTTSSLPYACRPYPLHDSIEQWIIRRQTSTMPHVDHHCCCRPHHCWLRPPLTIQHAVRHCRILAGRAVAKLKSTGTWAFNSRRNTLGASALVSTSAQFRAEIPFSKAAGPTSRCRHGRARFCAFSFISLSPLCRISSMCSSDDS